MAEANEWRIMLEPLGLAIEGPELGRVTLDPAHGGELTVDLWPGWKKRAPFNLHPGKARSVAELLIVAAGDAQMSPDAWRLEHRENGGPWARGEWRQDVPVPWGRTVAEANEWRIMLEPLGLAIEGPELGRVTLDPAHGGELTVDLWPGWKKRAPFNLHPGKARSVAELLIVAAGDAQMSPDAWRLEHRENGGPWARGEWRQDVP